MLGGRDSGGLMTTQQLNAALWPGPSALRCEQLEELVRKWEARMAVVPCASHDDAQPWDLGVFCQIFFRETHPKPDITSSFYDGE